MKRIAVYTLALLFCMLFAFLRIGFGTDICEPYYQLDSNQSCIEPSSPPSSCVPRLLGFTDCWSPNCPWTADSSSHPTQTMYKTSTWKVCWPSGQVHLYNVLNSGKCGTTQNSCCGAYVNIRCFPSFPPPEVGQGYFTQTTYKGQASVINVEFCSYTPCSKYNVFGDCSNYAQGDVFRKEVGCCLGNNDPFFSPSFSDHDGDGWCSDRDCDDSNPSIHTGCPGPVGACGNCGLPPESESDCNACSGWWVSNGDTYCCYDQTNTPIVIDVQGNGFDLTSAPDGVLFDIDNDGNQEHLSWTSAGSDDAWLVLDRNGNGRIDNGSELFGYATPQPPSEHNNGFLALAEYDEPANGGNGDGRISSSDSIFGSLRLWQDTNHNGLSEASELHTLPALHVMAMDLDYKTSKRTDQYGNVFRYRAKVRDEKGASVGRWAWDVFLRRE
jgi:hypothetical protein